MSEERKDSTPPSKATPTTPPGKVPNLTSEMRSVVLSRYRIVERFDERVVIAEDARNIALHVRAGLVVREEDRRNFPSQVVFLDGTFNGPPFLDNEHRQYSLDHHEGCVRPFTLATCEQAAVMLLKGLPIAEGDWHLFINQPDLDALLAAWVLMNHRELLGSGATLLRSVMPLLRVEGIIDTHGLEMGVLAGFSTEEYDRQKARLDQLLGPEREHRSAGTWASLDLVAYTCDRLAAIDALLTEAGVLRERAQVEVLGVRDIQAEKQVVLCRSTGGIYEVEARLRELYGKSLGVIILQTAPGRYALKQVDPFLSRDLVALYQALNARDPEAKTRTESGVNLWGGSADIGGSPRGSGTGLKEEEILDLTARVYRGTSWFKRLLGAKK